MEIFDIIVVGIIICLSAAAQSAIGFGYALFATPLLIWVGIPLPSVITLVATCSTMQAIMGARELNANVPWRESLTASAIRIIGVVVGLLLLKRLVTLNIDYIRAVIGCILCFLVVIQLLWRPHPVKTMHWGWAGLAFTTSGVLAGICGMGAPPLVLWSMAHDWPTYRTRGFLFAVFATSIPVQIVLLIMTFGTSILRSAVVGIALLPLVYLGIVAGLPIGNRMAKETLRRIAYTVLLAIGVSAISPFIVTSLR